MDLAFEYIHQVMNSFMGAYHNIRITMSNKIKNMMGWNTACLFSSIGISGGSPYNGHKGTPNIIHPPDSTR